MRRLEFNKPPTTTVREAANEYAVGLTDVSIIANAEDDSRLEVVTIGGNTIRE